MNDTRPLARRLAAVLLGAALVLATGCAVRPVIRAHTAPGANVAAYRTYGFFDKLGTDDSSYSSLLSTYLKSATALELESRGYRRAESNPDLLVNFHLGEKERIEGHAGPSLGLGLGRGWGWRSGYSWGLGMGVNDMDLRTTTEGTLTIDVVDRARNELIWAGSAVAQITSKTLDDPKAAIDRTVPLIFAKYPGRAQ
jgi:uncharacterized protein DUF4136